MDKAYKLIKRKVKVSPNIRKTIDLNAEVYSQDIDVTKIVLVLEDDNGEKIDLTDADVRVALQFNNVVIEDRGKVESVEEQSISYSPGERFKYQEGLVTIAFYVTLSTNQRIDISHFKINFKRSLIDSQRATQDLETQFISVNEFIEKEKKSYEKSRLGFNSIVDHVMDEIVERKKEFDLRLQELQEKIALPDLPSSYDDSNLKAQIVELQTALNTLVRKRPPMSFYIDRSDMSNMKAVFDNGCVMVNFPSAVYNYYYGHPGGHDSRSFNYYNLPGSLIKVSIGIVGIDSLKEENIANDIYHWNTAKVLNPIYDSSQFNFDDIVLYDYSSTNRKQWEKDLRSASQRNFVKIAYEIGALTESEIIKLGAVKK